jgi:protein-S-isoprenylcysteine O-methyltransferase Ste14
VGDTALVQQRRAAAGTALFLLLVPGVVAGLVPWLLTGWERRPMPVVVRTGGLVLAVAGLVFLVHAFARFVTEGRGTPAPVAPTEALVVGGVYRWVRNPMYLAVGAVIAGQALLLGRWVLAGYLGVFAAAVVAFVKRYEEPTLRARHGAAYDAYRRTVPGWWPRRPR